MDLFLKTGRFSSGPTERSASVFKTTLEMYAFFHISFKIVFYH